MRRAFAGIWLALIVGTHGALAQPAQPATPAAPGPHVEDPGKLPEPPPSVPDLVYDFRLLSSAAAAEQFQGPLDGGWTLGGKKGDLYAFELVDKRDALEGAWRDLRRPGQPEASGVLDEVLRTPAGLAIRFTPSGQAPVSVALKPNLRGELAQDGKRVAVVLRRATK